MSKQKKLKQNGSCIAADDDTKVEVDTQAVSSDPIKNTENTEITDTAGQPGNPENTSAEAVEDTPSKNTIPKKKSRFDIISIIRIICAIGFVIFTFLFINEVFIQPYRANKANEYTRELYKSTPTVTPVPIPLTETPAPTAAPVLTAAPEVTVIMTPTPTPDPTRDEQGRLLSFKELLAKNEDTKGWLTIPDSNMDYVVMQNSDDPDYYLTRDFNKEKQKAGCLYLDPDSSIEKNTQNLVIHGHNMKSTDNMFHYLVQFKKLDYYKQRPVFTFDSILHKGQWKIFAVFITNGSSKKEPLFNYRKSTFKDSSDFLNFIYQIRNRSLLNIDTVDVNENDQILCLSTCSYEINNYRTVIVARKVRDGEDPSVDVDSVKKNPHPLYPSSYYKNYGGEAPKLPDTFEEALEQGLIKWYPALANKNR